MAAALLALIALVGCSGRPYPSLATVPPRPAPTSSLEQRAAIGDALARDGAAARARADRLDGDPRTQPGQAPPSAVAPPAPPPPPPAPVDTAAEDYVAEAMERAEDDGELDDFLRQLERPVPGVEQPATAAGALGLPAAPQP